MPAFDFFKRISRAPTNPGHAAKPRQFDVADLYRGGPCAPEDGLGHELAAGR